MSGTVITLLIAELALLEPWAVSAPEAGGPLDAPLARDAAGNLYVPGAGIAGALRDHLHRHGLAEGLMGPRAHDNPDVELRASPLRVVGTDLQKATAALRHRTAVDRHQGAAAARTLRTQELAEPGAVLTVYLRYDGALPDEALNAIASWAPQLGGGASIGQGRASLTALRHGTIDLASQDGLAAWLTSGGPALHERVCDTTVDLDSTAVTGLGDTVIDARLRIVDGLLIGVEQRQKGQPDVVPLTRRGAPAVDASSLKGVLRSRVEYALRSVGRTACTDVTRGRACATCAACELFGAPDRPGILVIHSATIDDAVVETRTHVPIDRVTGGAAEYEGLLYTEQIVTAGTFPLTIRARRPLPAWGRVALLHALRDLHDGLIGLGRGTMRGQGTLELSDPSVLSDLDAADTGDLAALLAERLPQEANA